MDFLNLFDDLIDYEIRDVFRPRQHNIRPRQNLTEWSDVEFYRRFRLKKETVSILCDSIAPRIRCRTERNKPLQPMEKLLITLRYYATGSFYIVQGDFAGVHKSTVHKVVQEVTNALAELCPLYIKMPQNQEEIKKKQKEFYYISKFPRVICALDGTLVKIQSPGGPDAENFRCRKGYFALNVQAMCDAQYQFTNIVARWPGSAHDSNIFKNSNIRFQFERGDFGNSLILGDAGYQLTNYLMTPIGNPRTESEALYNEAHIRTRNVIERAFGIWKRRFPIVGLGMRCRVLFAQKIIVATAILHNIARAENEEPEIDPEIQEQIVQQPEDNINIDVDRINVNNGRTRQQLIDYFSNL